MLLTAGVALLCVAATPGIDMALAHVLLVLSFALPGGSYGYDYGKTADSAAFGTLISAVLGTVLVSLIVIAKDFGHLFFM